MRYIGNYQRAFDGLGAAASERLYSVVTYKVKRGDSLSLITWRFGRPAAETLYLYESNKQLIGSDPHAIKEGWELEIPANWGMAPVRTDNPTAAWIREAALALKQAGHTAQPTPPPSLPPQVIPQPAPPSIGPGVTTEFNTRPLLLVGLGLTLLALLAMRGSKKA